MRYRNRCGGEGVDILYMSAVRAVAAVFIYHKAIKAIVFIFEPSWVLPSPALPLLLHMPYHVL